MLYHAIFDLERRVFVLSGDDDRFTNHSDAPNTRYDGRRSVAVCYLTVGDEITCDYRELGWTEFLGLPPGSEAAGPRLPV